MSGLSARLLSYLPDLLSGTWLTVAATMVSVSIATGLGILAAIAKSSPHRWMRALANVYAESFRNTPPLVQLFTIFYLLPHVGIVLSPFIAGVIGISLYIGAYLSEVFRGSVDSIAKSQWEAARVLSMSDMLTWTRIILPQALVKVVPAWGNYVIGAFKLTALLSIITVGELMYKVRLIASNNFRYIELFTLATIIYFVISYLAILGIKHLETRLAITHGTDTITPWV